MQLTLVLYNFSYFSKVNFPSSLGEAYPYQGKVLKEDRSLQIRNYSEGEIIDFSQKIITKGNEIKSNSVSIKLSSEDLNSIMAIKKITTGWFTGIIDGDGSFGIILQRRKRLSVSFEMKITQHWHSADLLFIIKDFIGCGSVVIDNRKEKTLKYHVTNLIDIKESLIPLLEKNPLLTSKRLDYLDFKKVVNMVDNKVHLTSEGENLLIEIKKSINKGRSYTQRVKFSKEITTKIIPSVDWIMGFIDAEGCFYFGITSQKPRGSLNTKTLLLQPSFDITQNIRDFYILQSFYNIFKVGSFKLNGKKIETDFDPISSVPGIAKYLIKKDKDLKTLLSFLAEHQDKLLTSKALDYLDWVRLINIKICKEHLTKEGLSLIRDLKKGMNSGRKNYLIIDPRSKKLIDTLFNSTKNSF